MPAKEIRAGNSGLKGKIMWQVHTTFRLGDYKTAEIDVTPALAITLIIGIFSLIVRTGL